MKNIPRQNQPLGSLLLKERSGPSWLLKKQTLFEALLVLISANLFAMAGINYPGGFTPKIPKSTGFTENKGQVHDQNYQARPDVLFGGNDEGLVYHLKNNGISYQLSRVESWKEIEHIAGTKTARMKKVPDQTIIYRLDLQWVNANTNPGILKGSELESYNNYYLESCPAGALNVKSYESITYQNLYTGIDVTWYQKNGHLKYDYLVAAGIDYKQIQLKLSGAQKISLNARGELIIKTPLGEITEQAPVVVQNNKILASRWVIKNNLLSFDIKGLDASYPYIIDPVVRLWGTYYGGTGYEYASSCTTDGAGNVLLGGIAGTNASNNVATSGSHQSTLPGGGDCFLVKFTPGGVRQWGTYYGGAGMEDLGSCLGDAAGNIYITGYTMSSNAISTPGSHQPAWGGNGSPDAFLVKFNSAGVRQWGTYYGDGAADFGIGLSIATNGDLFWCGNAASTTGNVIATTGAYQATFAGGNSDAFLARFTTAGVRVWGTYYGGSNADNCYSCPTDVLGGVYISGETASSGAGAIATPGSHQPVWAGTTDAFLVKFDATTGMRLWGTYYGSVGQDFGPCSATDAAGNVYLAGYCNGAPGNIISTPGSHQPVFGGGVLDGYLVKFNSSGVRQWGTYYGDAGNDDGYECATDPSGNVYLCGNTTGSTGTVIATPCSHQPIFGGGTADDGYLVKFNTNGVRQWGTYYGGTGIDQALSVTTATSGDIYLCGTTDSNTGTVIASPASHQAVFGGGGGDGYLVKFTEGSATAPVAGPISGPVSICPGNNNTYSIAPVIGAVSYSWSLPGGWSGSSTTTAISATAGVSGLFSVSVLDACGAGANQTLSVTVNALPSLTVTASSKTICAGQSVTLTAGGASTYTWSPGGPGTSISVSPAVTTSYTASGTSTAGCISSITSTLSVKICTGIHTIGTEENELVVYPNPFTDKIRISGLTGAATSLQIFNALGSLVYNSVVQNETEVDFCDQPKGIYFIRIGSASKKIIKD